MIETKLKNIAKARIDDCYAFHYTGCIEGEMNVLEYLRMIHRTDLTRNAPEYTLSKEQSTTYFKFPYTDVYITTHVTIPAKIPISAGNEQLPFQVMTLFQIEAYSLIKTLGLKLIEELLGIFKPNAVKIEDLSLSENREFDMKNGVDLLLARERPEEKVFGDALVRFNGIFYRENTLLTPKSVSAVDCAEEFWVEKPYVYAGVSKYGESYRWTTLKPHFGSRIITMQIIDCYGRLQNENKIQNEKENEKKSEEEDGKANERESKEENEKNTSLEQKIHTIIRVSGKERKTTEKGLNEAIEFFKTKKCLQKLILRRNRAIKRGRMFERIENNNFFMSLNNNDDN